MPAKRPTPQELDPLSFTDFEWTVRGEYEWHTVRVTDQRLMPLYMQTDLPCRGFGLVANGGQWRRYQPLAVPGLFELFADTPTDRESIRGFANQFGHLGVQVGAEILPITPSKARWTGRTPPMRGE